MVAAAQQVDVRGARKAFVVEAAVVKALVNDGKVDRAVDEFVETVVGKRVHVEVHARRLRSNQTVDDRLHGVVELVVNKNFKSALALGWVENRRVPAKLTKIIDYLLNAGRDFDGLFRWNEAVDRAHEQVVGKHRAQRGQAAADGRIGEPQFGSRSGSVAVAINRKKNLELLTAKLVE